MRHEIYYIIIERKWASKIFKGFDDYFEPQNISIKSTKEKAEEYVESVKKIRPDSKFEIQALTLLEYK